MCVDGVTPTEYMVDYSKWDALEVSDSDGEDPPRPRPRVRRLDAPSRVTIRPGSRGVVVESGGRNAAGYGGPDVATTLSVGGTQSSSIGKESKKVSAHKSRQEARDAAAGTNGCAWWSPLVKNGWRGETYLWSQTRTDVTVRAILPNSAEKLRAKDIAVEVEEKRLRICIKGSEVLSGELRFPAVGVPDPLDVDWEIERGHGREEEREIVVVRVTLTKKKVVARVVVWWDRLFVHDKVQVDLGKITDRVKSAGSLTQATWEQAHKMFQERVASGEAAVPLEIATDPQ